MPLPLASIFGLYTLTPGRRIWALHRLAKLPAVALDDAMLPAIKRAVAQDRLALELDATRRKPVSTPKSFVREKDLAVDEALRTLDTLIRFFAKGGKEAKHPLSTQLFPDGVQAHVSLSQVDQSAANERVLAVLEGQAHAQWLDAHGVRPLIQKLRALHDAFRAGLEAHDDVVPPTWKQVLSARAAGQELYLSVVARIISEFADDLETRDALLQPIWDQNQDIKAFRRSRRAIVDVNPDTGELLDDAAEGADTAEEEDTDELLDDADELLDDTDELLDDAAEGADD